MIGKPKSIISIQETIITKPRGRPAAKSGKWIQGMHMKKGALHEMLDIPEGKKIPVKKLDKATHSKNPLLRQRANLAKTLERLPRRNG